MSDPVRSAIIIDDPKLLAIGNSGAEFDTRIKDIKAIIYRTDQYNVNDDCYVMIIMPETPLGDIHYGLDALCRAMQEHTLKTAVEMTTFVRFDGDNIEERVAYYAARNASTDRRKTYLFALTREFFDRHGADANKVLFETCLQVRNEARDYQNLWHVFTGELSALLVEGNVRPYDQLAMLSMDEVSGASVRHIVPLANMRRKPTVY